MDEYIFDLAKELRPLFNPLDAGIISYSLGGFIDSIAPIWERGEPMDGDKTEAISNLLLKALDKVNGNE